MWKKIFCYPCFIDRATEAQSVWVTCLNLHNKSVGRAKNWAHISWSLLQKCTFWWQWEFSKCLHLVMEEFFWNPTVLRMEDKIITVTLFSENAASFYFVQSLCLSRWIMILILSFNFHSRSKVILKEIKSALQRNEGKVLHICAVFHSCEKE